MGLLIGLMFGLGLLLIWRAATTEPVRKAKVEPRWRVELSDLIAQAGIESVTPGQVIASSAGIGIFVFVSTLVVSQAPTIALCFATFGAWSPLALLRWRQRQRGSELREVWPEIVDNLASAVRAGLSLPEAIAQIGVRGPEVLRPPFVRFGQDYRTSGRFDESIDRLKATLADPVGDRIIESVRMAREVGGSDLGRLLRTLSSFLREDARTRAELETRQGWTVNAARLALAAPWLMLGLLSLRPEAVRAYNSASGVVVLLVGGALSLVAYRVMLRIARLPTEQRVLR
ncbi:type II secretion system F family protein [Acidothermaceae bacterium B102]|nr:type II secretion system F family protein [Acidothermaceae bacterium B102]